MRTFFYACFLLITFSTFAVGQGRFSLSATVSPTLRRMDVTSHSYDSFPNGTSYSYNTKAEDQGGTVGLMAHYQFRPKWSVSSGLWYNRSSGHLDFQSYKNGNAYAPEPTRRTVLNTLQLPVLINFAPSNRRLSPYFSTGVVLSMNYRSAISPGYMNSETMFTHSSALRTNVLLGLGAHYRINANWALIVQPTALYRLNDLKPDTRQEFTHFRDWQVGVQAQLKYTF